MPFVTIALILANLAVFGLELAHGGMDVCYAHGLISANFGVERAFSSMFLHDPAGVFHLGGNMLFLAFFGTVVERDLGALRFGALYIVAGVAGALLHVGVNPSTTMPLVGASGAIFGVMGVAAVLRPSLRVFVLALASIEVFYAFTGGIEGVSFGCHIGGFCAGALFAALPSQEPAYG